MWYSGSGVVLDCIDSWSLPHFPYFVTSYCGLGSLKPPCELSSFVLHQQQNLERISGTSKMHLSPPLSYAAFRSKAVVLLLLISTPIVGTCNCYLFCCALLYVHFRFAIILIGKRELIALLSLSSWCLVIVVWLFLAVSWVFCSL